MEKFEKNHKKSSYYNKENIKMERMTISKKLFMLVLSLLFLASIMLGGGG